MAGFISSLIPDVHPFAYKFLVPPYMSDSEFLQLVQDGVFPHFSGLYPAIHYAIVLSILRYVLYHVLLRPLALRAMRLEPPRFFERDKVIEREFPDKTLRNNAKYVEETAKKLNSSSLYLRQYFKKAKRAEFVDKKVSKFVEAAWRFIFYFFFCVLGIHALIYPKTASWVLDTTNYWRGWPYEHQIEPAVYFYYMVELGAYLHQLAWTEVSRSDAVEMILHHIVTILLLSCSYLFNFSRIGSAIILIHDAADIFLESAKCLNYTGKAKGHDWAKTATDILFACFAITFFFSRLVYYPRFVVYDVLYILPIYYNNDWTGYYWFAGLLCTLQVLHCIWFYLIARMIYRLITTGIDKDERSDDEDEGEGEEAAATSTTPSPIARKKKDN